MTIPPVSKIEAMELVTRALLRSDPLAAQLLVIEYRHVLPPNTFDIVLRTAFKADKLTCEYSRAYAEICGRVQYQYAINELLESEEE